MSIHTLTYKGGAKVPNKVTGEGFSQINLSLSFVATAKVSSEAARANASGVLQCVVVGCSGLQCVAVYCSVVPWRLLAPMRLVCYSVLQCVAVCSSALQRGVSSEAACANAFGVLQCVAVCCSVLQCVAVCCSILQCVAVC